MEREEKKYYDEENARQEDIQSSEDDNQEINDMKYFLELLKCLRTALQSGSNVPFTNKRIVDAERCLQIIDDLENNLPDAVQYGLKMYSEQDRIMGNAESAAMNRVSSAEYRAQNVLEKAKHEAEQAVADATSEAKAIIDDAQERADHMVSDDEILRRARDEAAKINNEARVIASETRLKANHDAYSLLVNVESDLNKALKEIHQRVKELGDDEE